MHSKEDQKLADFMKKDRATVKAGETWIVEETAALKALTIEEGALVTAPEGKLLTLTVDGVELPLSSGRYKGDVVLTVTDDFPEIVDTYDIGNYRGALYVDKKGVDPKRSVTSALIGGHYDANAVEGVQLRSKNDGFTGLVYLAGEHELRDVDIELNGCGRNDFAGNGAAIVATGTSRVHAKGLKIHNKGMVRGAVLAADNGEIVVEDADIYCRGYSAKEAAEGAKRINAMKEVPWMLGLYGNNRATNIVGSGKATYINSTLRAEQWGVLSTDGTDAPEKFGDVQIRLNTKDCLVEITGASGYGSYSIGATCNTFDHTTFKVPDYALICANEYAAGHFINGSKVESKRFGVMWHQNQGGVLEVSDSEFKTGLTTFLVKGCYPDIRVKNSVIESENGVVLQLMDSDDPGMGNPSYATNAAIAVKDPSHSVTDPNYADLTMFHHKLRNYCTDLKAAFEDMTLVGDFYNGTTNACAVGMVIPEGQTAMQTGHGDVKPQKSSVAPVNLILSLKKVDLTGRITASTVKHSVKTITADNRRQLGMVKNTASAVVNNGVIVTLDAETAWTVTGNCYLSSLTIAEGAVIRPVEGKNLTMTVDGVQMEIAPGHYAGDIAFTVTDDYVEIVDSFQIGGYRAAIYADKDGVSKTASVLSAVPGAKLAKQKLSNLEIRSNGDNFNGLIFTDGEYEVKNVDIELNGRGGNDFAGVGAGIVATGKSKVTIDGLKIRTKGVIRGTVLGADHAKLTVRNADIYAAGETLEAAAEFGKTHQVMSGVPWMLGIYGNNRATNIVGSGHVTYENSVIRAERWGVLSTDGTDAPKKHGDTSIRLTAKDCLVELLGDSGYGSYSIGATSVTFDHSVVNVPDYAVICANEYAASTFKNGTVVNSGRFGVMWHQNQNGVTAVKESTFNTGLTTFLIKGCYPDIRVQRSQIHPANGVLVQLMDLDDPGMGNPSYRTNSAKAVKDETHAVTAENFTTANIFSRDIPDTCTDAHVSFKDMTLSGDMYNSTTNACPVGMVIPEGGDAMDVSHGAKPEPSTCAPINLVVTLENTDYAGVISSSTAKHAVKLITEKNRRELGMVTNKVSEAVNNGVLVTLGKGTRWTVTGKCCLTRLTVDPKASVVGADGKTVVMTVDGKKTEIEPGEYQGRIVLTLK